VYGEARRKNPVRWSGKTRDWSPIEKVWLNPEERKDKAALLTTMISELDKTGGAHRASYCIYYRDNCPDKHGSDNLHYNTNSGLFYTTCEKSGSK